MNRTLRQAISLADILVVVVGLAACGGKGKAVPGPLEVTAAASPEEIDLDGSVRLRAALTGTNSSTATVTWSAEPAGHYIVVNDIDAAATRGWSTGGSAPT